MTIPWIRLTQITAYFLTFSGTTLVESPDDNGGSQENVADWKLHGDCSWRDNIIIVQVCEMEKWTIESSSLFVRLFTSIYTHPSASIARWFENETASIDRAGAHQKIIRSWRATRWPNSISGPLVLALSPIRRRFLSEQPTTNPAIRPSTAKA